MEKHFPTHHFGVTKLCMLTFSTVLRKPCCEQAKAWLLRQNWFWSWEKLTIYIIQSEGETSIYNNRPILSFQLADESIDDTASTWTLFSHTGIYVMAIGLHIPVGLGIFCCYFFWCWPAMLACQPFWSGSLWHTTVDDDVEAAPS